MSNYDHQRYIIPRPLRYVIPIGKNRYETDTYIEIEQFLK